MNKVYCDGSYDKLTRLGTYCVVVLEHGCKATWSLHSVDGRQNSILVEVVALNRAIRTARALQKQNGLPAVVYTDCKEAIRHQKPLADRYKVLVEHIKAHTVFTDAGIPDENTKRQHWADVMAHNFLIRRLHKTGVT